ncbi:nitrogen regulation protein NR(II) [Acidicapsa dinghuensis]|uniref:histidine kinase n=1 Tax=Acidicapsa dinghuensis TaxID=2218256 RepID=A0ABW1EKS4_9BACT|nr:sensor histidine kinase [Acidicapsa dinghuensis]
MAHHPLNKTDLQRSLELVVKVGLSLAQGTDLKSLVQSATDAGLALCGAQFGAFFYNIVDAGALRYLPYTFSGADPKQFQEFLLPGNSAVLAPPFEGIAIVRSDDITQDPRYGKNPSYLGKQTSHIPVRSYLAVPVKALSGEVLGGLFYGHEDVEVFRAEHESLVAFIAAQAAAAIENFRLRDQLNDKIATLEKADRAQHDSSKHLAELAAIVESSDDAIISKDLNGIITSWNRGATHILGYTPEEAIGKSILMLLPQELHQEEVSILQKIRSGERIEHYETIRVTKSGHRINVSLTISPLRDRTGVIIGASKILRDISDRKRVEASLLQAEKIAAAGRMAATIAHEVNNPLEAVMNLIYLAQTNFDDSDLARNYLRAAESEISRVSHIARQTLGFYRENALPHPVSIPELIEDACRIYEPRCDTAGISIHTQLSSTRFVHVRKGEILQVISNLIANSIYAMPEGGTLALCTADVTVDEKEGVSLTVEDTGIGIPAELLPRIFEAFFTTRTNIGTGIGLFVARQFIEGHGGKITVSSSTEPQNHGTCITVFLPAENDSSKQ